jgi:hypothetical protein
MTRATVQLGLAMSALWVTSSLPMLTLAMAAEERGR